MWGCRLALEGIHKQLFPNIPLQYTQLGKPFETTYKYAERVLNRSLTNGAEPNEACEGLTHFYGIGTPISILDKRVRCAAVCDCFL